MNDDIRLLIDRTAADCIEGKTTDRDTIVQLLGIDPLSEEADYLRAKAGHAAQIITDGEAYLWGAIGVDSVPCSMNCRFCSFGEEWGLVKNSVVFDDHDIDRQVELYASSHIHYIVLRTTEFYSIDELCNKIRRLKKLVPETCEFILNTGEFDDEIAAAMHEAGVSGIYHALRLREGIDTGFDPSVRKRTMQAVKDSPLKLISLVEPVGPEHTDEELADAFLVTMEYGAAISGIMARIPVPGTPLGDTEQISPERIAQITAVFRLAAGDKIRDICVHPPTPGAAFAGGNVTVVEMGAIPRDDKVSAAEWLGYTASDAKAMMEEAGYRVISDVRKE